MLDNFYSRIGVTEKIRHYDSLIFTESTGHRGHIGRSVLPAPLHLLPSFATFPLLGWNDKLAVARAMLRIWASRGQPKLRRSMSMLEFLKQERQTGNAIQRFWRTVLVSALNEELDRIDAMHGITVFWKAFLSNRDGFLMGIPSVPLADLYASCGDRIARAGGQVMTRCGVAELLVERNRAIGVRLDNGSFIDSDYCVIAVTFDRLLKLLPPWLRDEGPFPGLSRFHVSPITGIHLWFDRMVMEEPFLTCVDQTIQWVFNKTKLCPALAATDPGQYLQIVISASYDLTDRSQQEIVDICVSDLARVLPLSRQAKLTRSVVIRENAATFSPEPGCDEWRPPTRTHISNLFLAGDWTQTGWPATMESAVRSGYQAAEAIIG
jgi:zeta-carotene desaturase